jgi:hypothetical protein
VRETTIGVDAERPLRSSSNHASWSFPVAQAAGLEVDDIDQADGARRWRQSCTTVALGAAAVTIAG